MLPAQEHLFPPARQLPHGPPHGTFAYNSSDNVSLATQRDWSYAPGQYAQGGGYQSGGNASPGFEPSDSAWSASDYGALEEMAEETWLNDGEPMQEGGEQQQHDPGSYSHQAYVHPQPYFASDANDPQNDPQLYYAHHHSSYSYPATAGTYPPYTPSDNQFQSSSSPRASSSLDSPRTDHSDRPSTIDAEHHGQTNHSDDHSSAWSDPSHILSSAPPAYAYAVPKLEDLSSSSYYPSQATAPYSQTAQVVHGTCSFAVHPGAPLQAAFGSNFDGHFAQAMLSRTPIVLSTLSELSGALDESKVVSPSRRDAVMTVEAVEEMAELRPSVDPTATSAAASTVVHSSIPMVTAVSGIGTAVTSYSQSLPVDPTDVATPGYTTSSSSDSRSRALDRPKRRRKKRSPTPVMDYLPYPGEDEESEAEAEVEVETGDDAYVDESSSAPKMLNDALPMPAGAPAVGKQAVTTQRPQSPRNIQPAPSVPPSNASTSAPDPYAIYHYHNQYPYPHAPPQHIPQPALPQPNNNVSGECDVGRLAGLKVDTSVTIPNSVKAEPMSASTIVVRTPKTVQLHSAQPRQPSPSLLQSPVTVPSHSHSRAKPRLKSEAQPAPVPPPQKNHLLSSPPPKPSRPIPPPPPPPPFTTLHFGSLGHPQPIPHSAIDNPNSLSKSASKSNSSNSSNKTAGASNPLTTTAPRKPRVGSSATSASATAAGANAGNGSRSSSKSGKKKGGGTALACLFCRMRKIACGPALEGDHIGSGGGKVSGSGEGREGGKTCNQCAKRSRKCEYPTESRRGQHKRKDKLKNAATATVVTDAVAGGVEVEVGGGVDGDGDEMEDLDEGLLMGNGETGVEGEDAEGGVGLGPAKTPAPEFKFVVTTVEGAGTGGGLPKSDT